MQIEIRADSVEITGYVNAVERKSKPLMSRVGQFIERICAGAFKRALKRNDNVRLLLNHNWDRDLGGTKDGNLELTEDNIGLRAKATITDPDVVDKARKGNLVGWSFGFTDIDVDNHLEDGVAIRDVRDLNLYEVSLLDRSKIPAYDGTLVTVRSDDEIQYHGEPLLEEIEIREAEIPETEEEPEEAPVLVEETAEETAEEVQEREAEEEPKQHENVENKEIDYSPYEAMIKEMKGES